MESKDIGHRLVLHLQFLVPFSSYIPFGLGGEKEESPKGGREESVEASLIFPFPGFLWWKPKEKGEVLSLPHNRRIPLVKERSLISDSFFFLSFLVIADQPLQRNPGVRHNVRPPTASSFFCFSGKRLGTLCTPHHYPIKERFLWKLSSFGFYFVPVTTSNTTPACKKEKVKVDRWFP